MRKTILFTIILLTFSFSVFSQTAAEEITKDKLHLIKTIYVGEMGKSDEAERFRLLLEEELSEKGFTVVDKAEKADGILTGILTVRVYDDTSIARATVSLKSQSGTRIWGDDFEPKSTFKRVEDTVKFRAENVAGRLRKVCNKSAEVAGIKVD